ncbi:FecR family protein [Carboxylicivirga linearis]|uniref:FecR domain-containing protein n=1 Tax=Carboxylicivirga linearis TaxID=1628157 RepID=A0ABS5JY86_9BACT|nr:FecR domain-containing protein [Carboxylicivirga linearis]MBS2099840.1 FecR domain-containing protein [Carboxylicivirga linearis]
MNLNKNDIEIRKKLANMDNFPEDITWDVNNGWEDYQKKYSNRRHTFRLNSLSIAAAVIIAIVSIGIAISIISKQNNIYINTTDHKKDILLSDGSIIWLNINSEIKIAGKKIKLNGEAYFELKGDNQYKIQTPQGDLFAEHSYFNIKARKISKKAILTVSMGTVDILWKSDISLKTTVPNGFEACILPEIAIIQRPLEDRNYLAWKTEELHFENTPFYYVVDKLEDLNKIKINLSTNELRYCRVNENFHTLSPNEILTELSKSLNFKLNINDHQVYIEGDGCS